MNRADIESFFKTLLLGDFDEHQNAAAQIVGGLISLIPILGQVMAGRDITGTLFNINKRGGFKSAAPEQLVNLGFAAFGAIPELGPVFKTVFKPLWKERQLAKGAVHGGMAAIEALLGLGKGGAVTWIRKELIGKWAARTQQMIAATLAAMDLCIGLMDFVATASGWQDWLIPDSIQALAKELLPGLKTMRGQVSEPLTRASNEIREFLEDLLGERAAAVVMAIGGTAIAASAVPATRTRAGHNAAEVHPTGKAPARQPEVHVKAAPKTQAAKGAGPVHAAIQLTLDTFKSIANQEKGLIGEHMADYHELKRLGGSWPHDKTKGAWTPVDVKKINSDKRPVNLALHDLPRICTTGLDAVWQHHGKYTVAEAKFSASVGTAYGAGKGKVKRGKLPAPKGLNPSLELLYYLLSDNTDKKGVETTGKNGLMVQMSKSWVMDRGAKEGLPAAAVNAIKADAYDRRTLFVSFEVDGALDHGQALADIHMGKREAEVHTHLTHGIMHEWGVADIDRVVDERVAGHKTKSAGATSTKAEVDSGSPTTKKTKPKKAK
jgi:hypothetical protein